MLTEAVSKGESRPRFAESLEASYPPTTIPASWQGVQRETRMKTSPPRASANSSDDDDGQRDSLMIPVHFVKEIHHGGCTCTCVGAKIEEICSHKLIRFHT